MIAVRITKTQRLIGYMRAGDWPRALSLANTFRMLGTHRDTIRLAHECRVWPRFYRALGRDTDAAGIAALQQLYPYHRNVTNDPQPTSDRSSDRRTPDLIQRTSQDPGAGPPA